MANVGSLMAQTSETSTAQAPTNSERKLDPLEIQVDDFFVISIYGINEREGEFDATVYLTLDSIQCPKRIGAREAIGVGDAFFPKLDSKENLKSEANKSVGYGESGPFQFIQFSQGRAKLTRYFCEDVSDFGRWQGEFELTSSQNWDTKLYPFDKHSLHIEFETPLSADIARVSTALSESESRLGLWARLFDLDKFDEDEFSDLNSLLNDWRIISRKSYSYPFDYNTCFGYDCDESTQLEETCSETLSDEKSTSTERSFACADIFWRHATVLTIERRQNLIIPILVFLGPALLLSVAFSYPGTTVQRNQVAVTSAAAAVTGYFGTVSLIGSPPLISLYSASLVIYVIILAFYFYKTIPKLRKM